MHLDSLKKSKVKAKKDENEADPINLLLSTNICQ